MRNIIIIVNIILTFHLLQAQEVKEVPGWLKEQVNESEALIGEYNIQLLNANSKFPNPTKAIEINLMAGNDYNIYLHNAKKEEPSPLVKIYYKNNLIITNNDGDNLKSAFSFTVPKTGKYKVVVSFNKSKQGQCQLVLTKFNLLETTFNDPVVNNIYLHAEYKVELNDTLHYDSLMVTVDNADIYFEDGDYYFKTLNYGDYNMQIQYYSGIEHLLTEKSKYKLVPAPLPLVLIDGADNFNNIFSDPTSINMVQLKSEIENDFYTYEIIGFTICIKTKNICSTAYGSLFNQKQKEILQQLERGDKFIIKDCRIKRTDGAEFILEPAVFTFR